ncbi:MAG: hypothetical protein MZV70_54280 [Desulfobacterales bacterium]|nr:hypothetical protein [Desulfobacterales bacterium]
MYRKATEAWGAVDQTSITPRPSVSPRETWSRVPHTTSVYGTSSGRSTVPTVDRPERPPCPLAPPPPGATRHTSPLETSCA